MDVPPLPAAFRLRPDPGLRLLRGGRVLLGGSPYRLMRLTARAVPVVSAWLDGKPVGGGRAAGLLARRLVQAGMMHPGPPSEAPRPTVTFVVPVRDRSEDLARCLAGLSGGPDVIVVDDASTDPGAVAEVVRAAGATLVRRPVNGGPAAARNTGLARAAGDLVAFVDSDCLPESGWADALLPHFADPAVAAVAPRIVAAGSGKGFLAAYERARSALDMGPRESLVRPGAHVPYVPSAALVVRRAAVARGFDEGMRVGEDVDLVWRLAADGHHVRYAPTATVAHRHRTRPRQWLAQRVQYGSSAAPLAARHPGLLPATSMSGWSALAWGLVLARRPLAGALVTAGATGLLARKLAGWSDRPWTTAAKLAGGGTLTAGEQLGRAVTRTWWPLALPLAAAVPRLRIPLAAAALLPPLLEHRRSRPPLPVLPWTLVRLADDAAYGLGVWKGCVRERTTRPLRPRLWWRSADGVTPPSGRDRA
ncbi:mycofactocin biosynthesis glycosyltransferase MftF [Streptomyces sp. NPDC050145]|uniref:mycofactocin biosynthesis glycosyltransferase MftF n=1 Tax=Streptomyces sp. NPDC050145 TaxID=3365602 RepID=UPI00378ABD5E